MGSLGKVLGDINRHLFGYVGFIYPFILTFLFPLILRIEKLAIRFFEIFLSLSILFLDFLIIQANIFSNNLQGYIGSSIEQMLQNFIGSVGVWLFIIMIGALSFIILFDVNINDILQKISKIKSFFKFFKKTKPLHVVPSENISLKNKQIKPLEEKYAKTIKLDEKQNETKANMQVIQVTQNETKTHSQVANEQNDTKNINEDEKIQTNELSDEDLNTQQNLPANIQHANVEVLNEVEENKKLLESLEVGEREKPKHFKLPTLDFLANEPKTSSKVSESEIDQKISDLLDKLRRFKIDGDVVRTYAGPVVTTFEFRPAPHIKVSKILTLQDDLAMALKAQTIRIQAPVPGKDVVGIEIPNKHIDTIYLKSILQSDIFQKSSSPLTIVLGKDIVGNPFVTDLKKLPHLLIAGTTGSGKSVGINAMLLSLLYRNSPESLRLLMIDPKMLEFSMYNDIPHLLTPVITQSKEAVCALSNMVLEMERRYQVMSRSKTKNIESYNEKAQKEGWSSMPYIVIIIDELADLMMTSGKDVEFYISRLAQMARASGIHLLVATQRPSVDVVTGLIKANLPSRISFKVGQKIDSKVILDSFGAESLLGRGDMLFTPPSIPGAIRLHAPYTSEKEIETVVEYLKTQAEPNYDKSYLKDPNVSDNGSDADFDSNEIDELFEQAKSIVLSEQKTSISYIQRRLQIGYNRAARIIEQLEKLGVLSAPNSKGQREIIV